MTIPTDPAELGQDLMHDLPYLRRYARALTGSQEAGDRIALAALERIVENPEVLSGAATTKVGLFRQFHALLARSGETASAEQGAAGSDIREERAQWRLGALAPHTREALLLRSIEEFGFAEIGEILGTDAERAEALYDQAMDDMAGMVRGKVLIIEDEGIIAMDLKSIVTDMGHEVTAIARTHTQAVRKGTSEAPDLILADIQLADRSSGIDAVKELLETLGDIPVIFITAFPERLLTGERVEPAFLITKPYEETQVCAAVSQAMFFRTTEEMDLAV